MRFLTKKKIKPKEFFRLEYSAWVGLREEHYREIYSQLPFHTADISSEFVIISFECPFLGLNHRKQFYHLGKRMDLSQYKDKIKQISTFPVLTADEISKNELFGEGEPLPSKFNPCTMCEREMQCLFASTNLSYKPKRENNQEAIIKILQDNGFVESKELYHKYVAYDDDQRYSEMGPQTVGEFFLLLILLIPLIIFFIPWLIFSSFVEKFEDKQ